MRNVAKSPLVPMLLALACFAALPALAQGFSYGGRLTDGDNAVRGPVDLELNFFRTASGGSPLIAPLFFNAVPLVDGVFQLDVKLSPSEASLVLDADAGAWLEVKDLTSRRTLPRQRLTAMPLALRVPVDGTTITYDSDGKLRAVGGGGSTTVAIADVTGLSAALSAKADASTVSAALAGKANAVHSHTLGGDVTGDAASASVVALRGRAVAATAPSNGEVLKWNGNAWAPAADATSGGGGGESTTASNAGAGAQVFKTQNTHDLQFRSLLAGAGLQVSQGTDEVTISAALTPSHVPALDASKITTGTFDEARIPQLDAAKIGTGTLSPARLPPLSASMVTTGVFNAAQIPGLDASKITTGTFPASLIPNLDTSKITTGNLDASRLGSGGITNAELARLAGVTSPIQTQLDGKASTAHAHNVLSGPSGSPSTVLFADGSGRVGIGTTSPQTHLHLVSSVGATTIYVQSPTGQNASLKLKEASTPPWELAALPSGALRVTTGGSTVMSLDTSGRLGVGTTTPQAALDVHGDARVSQLQIANGTPMARYLSGHQMITSGVQTFTVTFPGGAMDVAPKPIIIAVLESTVTGCQLQRISAVSPSGFTAHISGSGCTGDIHWQAMQPPQ